MDLLYVDVPSARSLARLVASIQEYRRGRVWSRESELNWRREDFDIHRLQFRPNDGEPAHIRLSRYQNPITSIWHYRLWQNGESAEVDPDWGRYSILALSSRNVLQYDPSAREVRVPFGAPLPALFARSLGLCSGHCSIQSERVSTRGTQRYYVFDDVPPSLFNAVANKLKATTYRNGSKVMDFIGAFDRVRDSYVDYVKTAFGTQYPGLEVERERLLRQPGTISQEPWIEPIPRYQTSGKKIGDLTSADLPGMTPEEIVAFQALARCGLIGDFELHGHQLETLSKVLSGTNAVVTAGTGSGKTEAFLLPLFAYLIRESSGWNQPAERSEHQDDWWRDESWRN